MDYTKVLRRAWHTVWNYRTLWIFGIILALTTGGGSWSAARGDGDAGSQYNFRGEDLFRFEMGEMPPAEVVSILIAVGIGLLCVIVVLAIAATIARYVAETALIRMVDDHEKTGQKHSVRQGFRMGWSRTAFRLFLIKLLIGLPTALAFILLFALAFAPLLLWVTGSKVAGGIGTVTTIGLFFPILFLAIVAGVVLSLLQQFFWRACALEEMGVIESIRQGFSLVRRHLKDVIVMWFLMIGVQIGWVIALIATAIVLFPAIILLIVVGGVLAGLPALLVGGLASLIFQGAVPWILAGVVGLPIFILAMAAPWIFLGGLMEAFKSSVWTLSYQELRALEPAKLPELDASGLEVAPIAQ